MKTKPLVSIIVLTYNGEKFLEEQIDSILNQSYKNIEIIISDDASTDNTVNIIKKYSQLKNIKYKIRDTNVGINQNFIEALSLCNGEFIAPSDQDDIWLPKKIEKLVTNIRENVLIYSSSSTIDENGHIFNDFDKEFNNISGSNNKAFFFIGSIPAHNMLFKKELIKYIESNIPPDRFYDMWVAFIALSHSSIIHYPNILTYYRRHNSQLTSEKVQKKTFGYFLAKYIKQINFINRFIYKDKMRLKSIQNRITLLEHYSELKVIDNKTREDLNDFIMEFKKAQYGYFNKTIYNKLIDKKDKYLAIFRDKKHKKMAKTYSRGIWYYRIRLHI